MMIETCQAKKTIGALTRLLGDNDMSGKVRALLCIGIAKLVLAGMITDQQVSCVALPPSTGFR